MSLATIWAPTPQRRQLVVDGEVEDVELVLVELVDHEADDFFAVLRDHADAVALTEAAEEVFFRPGELEAGRLDVENFGHVPADHPADVNAHLFLLGPSRVHHSLLAAGLPATVGRALGLSLIRASVA